jgi:uracil-DNA glycosylase
LESPFDPRPLIRQQLQSLKRDGLSHWQHLALPAAPAAQSSSRPQPLPRSPAQPKSAQSPALDEQPLDMPKRASAPPSAPHQFVPLDLALPERVSGLKVLQEKVKACTRCSELASTRTQTVFGVGNPQARIAFVGEAPGADEDAQGEPFVGRAGQLLNDIIKACRITREELYICNVLRCRPPGNRLPSPEEAGNCREYLDGQLAIVNPEYIVCWGSTAAKNLLASEETIGKLRGRFFQYGRSKVLCTYHPSYLLRNPSAKKEVWEDMKLLFLDMGIDLTKPAGK